MVGQLYNDLCAEIDILETRISDLEFEYWYWYKACFGARINRAIPLDVCLNRMKVICDQVEVYSTILEEKEKARKEIEKRMADIESIEGKVAYMRDVKGMTLAEIAADLNFSYSWIKKLSMRTSKGTRKELTG
ncbi:hypothetical protein H1164_03495 [Thermoactinomyces daqus]|uniref:Uncharacterized protein n=1 Tax=Thermoactinomyces daqus TaxID=1329516 RepID=A0A7W1X8D4_9BACL|nr:hypothetical protein [Thermoactinomyces daqus]MBA4541967.1 hypothetical protein [Thermoactinomyces daqus]